MRLEVGRLWMAVAACACLALAACGGGGGGSPATTPSTPTAPTPVVNPDCPYTGDTANDGCAGRPAHGSFLVSSFFGAAFPAHAIQSGQTWSNNHPQNFNVAGVDYAIGYSTDVTLQDPATAPLPTGCTYHTGGNQNPTGGPYIVCVKLTGTTRFENFNFGPAFGHDCIPIVVSAGSTGELVFNNDNFDMGANCAGLNTATTLGSLISIQPSGPGGLNLTMTNVQLNGEFPKFHNSLLSLVNFNTGSNGGNFTCDDSVWLNSPVRFVTIGGAGSVTCKHSYAEGVAMLIPNAQHGEFLETVNYPDAATVSLQQYSFMTFVTPANTPPASATTWMYFAVNSTTAVFSNVQADHNTVVVNSAGPFGWSLSGATLSITSLPSWCTGANCVTIGANFSAPGLSGSRRINAYGTGSGGVGTYAIAKALSGPSSGSQGWLTVHSAAAVEFGANTFTSSTLDSNFIDPTGATACFMAPNNPTFTNLTVITGNVNLRDGSAVTGIGYQNGTSVLCNGAAI